MKKKEYWKLVNSYYHHFGRIGDDWYWVASSSQEMPEGIWLDEAHGPFSTMEEAEADSDRFFREMMGGKITVDRRH
jgi:hypothetical protein